MRSLLVLGLVLGVAGAAVAQTPVSPSPAPTVHATAVRTTLYEAHQSRDARGNLDFASFIRPTPVASPTASAAPTILSTDLDLISTMSPNAGRPWENLPSGMYTQSISPLVSDPLSRQ